MYKPTPARQEKMDRLQQLRQDLSLAQQQLNQVRLQQQQQPVQAPLQPAR